IPLNQVDSIAKQIPDTLNITIEKALKQEPQLAKLVREDKTIAKLFDISKRLQGLARHASTHAAGVVISDKPIVEYLPLAKGKKGETTTQFEMKAVEEIGLVKFDFLGLRNLTVIENTLKAIAKIGETPPDILNLNLSDKKSYELLIKGDTNGVFQLESSGMKDLLIKLRPSCFDDIIALVALYRPGPMESGMINDYVDRKHGRQKVEYLIPQLEKILKETYGVIVYQEQVMNIAGEAANYSMAEADDLRKAMGKKLTGIMAKHKKRFISGAVENGINKTKAERLFDLIEKFGGYGFNKSHSAAYALIAFQTAYLKAHYPLQFMAALLTSEVHSIETIAKYIAECKTHKIKILPPDINKGSREFTVEKNAIRFGLAAVKNVGAAAIEKICEERENGKYTSVYNFTKRAVSGKVNKRVTESLIKCGAFDSTNHKRSQMIAVLDDAIETGQKIQKDKKSPQKALFDTEVEKELEITPDMPDIEELDQNKILRLEKEILGFYLSGNPLDEYADTLKNFASRDTETVLNSTQGDVETIGGIIINVKTILTKKGDQMAFIILEDFKGTIEITVFNSVYTVAKELLEKDTPVIIKGKIEKDQNTAKMLAEKIIPIQKAEENLTAEIFFKLDAENTDKQKLIKLKNILLRYPGKSAVFLKINIGNRAETIITLPNALKIRPCAKFTEEVKTLFGYNPIK
ncbi:MAG: DNA polymerase III subunit alpha, partial [Deltaproteobacteria bacterium]|nr:DNA polymerase III subunit alpha [Deltaproteobacteria bacterium]